MTNQVFLFAFLIICNFFFHHISKKLISLIFDIPSGAGNPKSHFCNEMGTLTLNSCFKFILKQLPFWIMQLKNVHQNIIFTVGCRRSECSDVAGCGSPMMCGNTWVGRMQSICLLLWKNQVTISDGINSMHFQNKLFEWY